MYILTICPPEHTTEVLSHHQGFVRIHSTGFVCLFFDIYFVISQLALEQEVFSQNLLSYMCTLKYAEMLFVIWQNSKLSEYSHARPLMMLLELH